MPDNDADLLLAAIDPGVSTGVALKIPDVGYRTCTLLEPSDLWDMLLNNKPDWVAFETFATGGRVDANMLRTIELVGSIRGICYALGISVTGQQPQARRSFLDDAAFVVGDIKGATRHEVDAMAHLLLLEHRLTTGDL